MSAKDTSIKKVVLAYSGGLDTSVAIQWLIEVYKCQVIAFCADLGQGEDLQAIKEKALQTGASKVHLKDLKAEWVSDYIFPMLRANALYEGYLLGTAIARPLIAKAQLQIARQEKAEAVAHGATGKGNDQVRFELTYLALQPEIRIIAPWREWKFRSRNELMEYARRHRIMISATKERPYSIDRNLFHVSYEGGLLEDPWKEPPEDLYLTTVASEKAPDRPAYLEIGYKAGDPVSVNGKPMPPAQLLAHLNEIGGAHGIGRLDLVENRYVGIKSRGIYETPGGTILHVAHRAIESVTMDREVMHLRDSLIPRYAEMIYNGYWFSPEREMLQTAMDQAQRGVTGRVRVKLYKGSCQLIGRQAPDSLYRPELATFEEGEPHYRQQDADGFIRLNALRLKLQAPQKKKGHPIP